VVAWVPISERARRSLQEFGLTDYEIRAYNSLLDLGAATASELSEAANVPYSKIYEVLGSLERKGWIEMEHGRPSKYYPKPPSVAIEITKQEFENKVRTNETLVIQELQPLYERKEVHERPDIWIVRGELNIIAKIRETIENAQRELLVASPEIPDSLVDAMVPIVRSVAERGVKVLAMTMQDVSKSTMEKLSKICEVRLRAQMFGGGIIVDGREVILLLGGEGNDRERTSLAIWSDHIGLARFARNYFEYLWHDSKPHNNRGQTSPARKE
jgi:sugar-specific transcriptional regulator TrmB